MLLLGRDSAVSAFAGIRTNALPILVSARSVSTKRGGSSSRYLQRQKTDVFVKQRQNIARTRESANDVALAPSGSYVSRSAFKLLQLDDKYKFLRAGRTIVDLGAAPGGWTQAIIERVTRDRAKRGKKLDERTTPVFALDILPMSSIAGVRCLQGDFLDPNVQDKLRRLVAHKTQSNDSSVEVSNGGDLEDTEFFVDVVVSDMMSNTSGNSTADSEASLSLCQAAYTFAKRTLRPRAGELTKKSPPDAASASVLVMKHFMSHEADQFRKQVLEKSFHFVKSEKMDASRKASREQFWVCVGRRNDMI